MVEEIGRFVYRAVTIADGRGMHELRGFLTDLFEAQVGVGEQAPRIAGSRRVGVAIANGRIEPMQGARTGIAKAGLRPGMAGWSRGNDMREHGVAVAIPGEADDALRIAARRALSPQAARSRGVVHFTCREGLL